MKSTRWLAGLLVLTTIPSAWSVPNADSMSRGLGGGPVAGDSTPAAPDVSAVPVEPKVETDPARQDALAAEFAKALSAEDVNLQTVQILMDLGLDVKKANRAGVTPLEVAINAANEWQLSAYNDHFNAVVEFLLRKGADVNQLLSNGETPLIETINRDNSRLSQILIADHADAARPDRSGGEPLSTAMERGAFDVAKALIEAGADVNSAPQGDELPLAVSAYYGGIGMVEYLVNEKHAKVNAVNNGITALEKASVGGHLHVMQFLIDHKADVNLADNARGGSTPLAGAAMNCNVEAVRLLMKSGADPTIRVAGQSIHLSDRGPDEITYDEGKTPAEFAAVCPEPAKEAITKILAGSEK